MAPGRSASSGARRWVAAGVGPGPGDRDPITPRWTKVACVVDVQFACLERPVLVEGQPEPTRHLHRSQSIRSRSRGCAESGWEHGPGS